MNFFILKNAKKAKLSLLLTFAITVFSQNMFAQTLQVIDSMQVAYQQISIDNYANLYLTNDKGAIFGYDSLLKPLSIEYSPEKIASVALLEARNALRMFVFYREFQEYALLDRFLTVKQVSPLPTEKIGFARLATPSADNHLWILDDNDFSLKKLDLQTETVSFSTPLDLLLGNSNYDIVFMTEYQNQLFLVDKYAGILIFDNMGNFRRKIIAQNLSYISFEGEMLWFTDGKSIFSENIYKTNSTTKIALPNYYQTQITRIIKAKNFIWGFANNQVFVFRLS
jgi:hypothetical protein